MVCAFIMLKSVPGENNICSVLCGLFSLKNTFSPLVCHAIHELLFCEFTLCCCLKLPGNDEDTYTGWIQTQVITELLDPVNADLVVITRI